MVAASWLAYVAMFVKAFSAEVLYVHWRAQSVSHRQHSIASIVSPPCNAVESIYIKWYIDFEVLEASFPSFAPIIWCLTPKQVAKDERVRRKLSR
jgi:hypothetical protein